MPLSQENVQRLEKIAKVAVPLALGAVAVHTIRRGNISGYVRFMEDSRVFFVGVVDHSRRRINQFTGEVIFGSSDESKKQLEIEIDARDLSPGEIGELEDVFGASEEHHQSTV